MYFVVKLNFGYNGSLGREGLITGLTADIFVFSTFTYAQQSIQDTVDLQWLEHFWDHENMFETGVVQANEC